MAEQERADRTAAIRAKLAAMLRLARDGAATPAEAATAAAMAQELADKYRLDLGSIVTDDRAATATGAARRKNGASWRSHVWQTVSRANGCYIVLESEGHNTTRIWGHPRDVEVVEYLGVYLERLLDTLSSRAYKAYRDEFDPDSWWERPTSARAYKLAWCRGASQAVRERYSELRQSSTATMGYGLIVVSDLKAMARAYYAEQGRTLGPIRMGRVSDGGAYNAGHGAGQGISLNRGVGGQGVRQLGAGS